MIRNIQHTFKTGDYIQCDSIDHVIELKELLYNKDFFLPEPYSAVGVYLVYEGNNNFRSYTKYYWSMHNSYHKLNLKEFLEKLEAVTVKQLT